MLTRSRRSGPETSEPRKKSGSYTISFQTWRCAKVKMPKVKMPKVTCPLSLCIILRAVFLHKRTRSPRDHEEPLRRTKMDSCVSNATCDSIQKPKEKNTRRVKDTK